MSELRITQQGGPPRPRRARRAEALVTQYIHELSDRHARSRNGTRPRTGRPRRGRAGEHATEPQGE